MGIELTSDRTICSKCGMAFGRRQGNFPTCYALLYKGIGYIPICKECIDTMYNGYLAQCGNAKDAVRQMCRKLDLYWSDKLFNLVEKKSTNRTMMTQYITKINTIACAGKSYDDTLSEDGTLWSFRISSVPEQKDEQSEPVAPAEQPPQTAEELDIPEELIEFWGDEYLSTPDMYEKLERRKAGYISKLSDDIDIGTEMLLRQICILEVGIAKDSAAGKPVEKSVTALNTLVGSLNLKPAQKKDEGVSSVENTPFGVWVRKWEDQRPIPEPDPELKDVDGIIRYISIYFLGHLCKMLNIKNSYCKLYEEELAKIRVERPEYEDEDDENMFNDIFGGSDSESDTGGDTS